MQSHATQPRTCRHSLENTNYCMFVCFSSSFSFSVTGKPTNPQSTIDDTFCVSRRTSWNKLVAFLIILLHAMPITREWDCFVKGCATPNRSLLTKETLSIVANRPPKLKCSNGRNNRTALFSIKVNLTRKAHDVTVCQPNLICLEINILTSGVHCDILDETVLSVLKKKLSGEIIVCALIEPQCLDFHTGWTCEYANMETNNSNKKNKPGLAAKSNTRPVCPLIHSVYRSEQRVFFFFFDQPLTGMRLYLYLCIHTWNHNRADEKRLERRFPRLSSGVKVSDMATFDSHANYTTVTARPRCTGDLQA